MEGIISIREEVWVNDDVRVVRGTCELDDIEELDGRGDERCFSEANGRGRVGGVGKASTMACRRWLARRKMTTRVMSVIFGFAKGLEGVWKSTFIRNPPSLYLSMTAWRAAVRRNANGESLRGCTITHPDTQYH